MAAKSGDSGLTERPEWRVLVGCHERLRMRSLRELFAGDPGRAERFAAEGAGLYLDYSKNHLDEQTRSALLDLARARGLPERIEAMFRGEAVNTTQCRPALHVALRAARGTRIEVGGEDVVPGVHRELERMQRFCESLRSGQWRGHGGSRIRHLVHVGIGGSDLGPRMAWEALRGEADGGIDLHFVSNVDAADFATATRGLDAAETLFVVCSKSFRTQETRANARAARRWCVDAFGEESAVARHFVAVSSNPDEAVRFGIDRAACFELWDWVGGRYSLPSAIGLSLMAGIGAERFREFLAGLRAMDEHFRTTPLERNLPVLLGLLRIWYGNFFACETHCVVPYSRALWQLPAYLQQLEMESNGKSVDRRGFPVPCATGTIVWGQAGTDAQHAFFQLLHQGTRLVPCDFIGFLRSHEPIDAQHTMLMANCFAQSRALAFGCSAEELRAQDVAPDLVPHRVHAGNRPSSTILADRLTPRALGALIALYEHSVFVQSAIWQLNPFDQWGVELGKQLADELVSALAEPAGSGEREIECDSSTAELIRRYRQAHAAEGKGGADA